WRRGGWLTLALGFAFTSRPTIAIASATVSISVAPTAVAATSAATTAIATVATTPIASVATSALAERSAPGAGAAVRLRAFALVTFGRLEQCAARQVYPTLAVDLGNQHLDLIADVDHVLDRRHAVVGQL